jgi:hypothetical protein
MQIRSAQLTVFALLIAFPFGAARADIYRCSGVDGRVLYSDSPCPHGAAAKSNITTAVGACTTAECEAKRQQDALDARERLRAEKEELAERTSKRRQEDLEYERERARLEELRWRQSVEARLAATADDAANAAAYAPYYPVYPGFQPTRPCRNCGRPQPRPHHPGSQLPDREQGVQLRMNR